MKKIVLLFFIFFAITARVDFAKASTIANPAYTFIVSKSYNRCDKLFQTITINPHSQLLACCGLTVEYNKFLKLGNLQEHSLKELYDFQFNDVFLLWLYTHGSKYIYEKVKSHKGEKIKNFTHPCAYCIEIMNDPSNRDIIHEILQSELPRILFRLEMINKKLIQSLNINHMKHNKKPPKGSKKFAKTGKLATGSLLTGLVAMSSSCSSDMEPPCLDNSSDRIYGTHAANLSRGATFISLDSIALSDEFRAYVSVMSTTLQDILADKDALRDFFILNIGTSYGFKQ